jgi:glycosyltransferase involved in cell wall biosynthesis
MSPISDPRISIVMPVFNAEAYVSAAIESILCQTFSDFEFLIFDDGSTDTSLSILQQYAKKDARLRVFAKPHEGMTRWLNEGIAIARGDLIARMDADDLSLPDRFNEQVKYLDSNPRCVVVGTDLFIVDENGLVLGTDRHEYENDKIQKLLLNGTLGVVTHASSMMRRKALLAVGSYRNQFEGLEDLDLLLRLSEIGQLGNIPQILFKVRVHSKSVCATKFRSQERLATGIMAEARARKGLLPLGRPTWPVLHDSDDEAARFQLWSGCFVSFGNRRVALRYALLALHRQPFSLTSWIALARVVLPNELKIVLKLFRPAPNHS